jgi:hypothetical protein
MLEALTFTGLVLPRLLILSSTHCPCIRRNTTEWGRGGKKMSHYALTWVDSSLTCLCSRPIPPPFPRIFYVPPGLARYHYLYIWICVKMSSSTSCILSGLGRFSAQQILFIKSRIFLPGPVRSCSESWSVEYAWKNWEFQAVPFYAFILPAIHIYKI